MKTTILLLAVVFAVTACRTTNNPSGVATVVGHQIDPSATGKAVQVAAKYGALEAIRQKPETREYFKVASFAISGVIANGDYSPQAVQEAINNLTGNQVASQAISDAIDLYRDFFGKLVADKLDSQSPYTVPVLVGLATGLAQAVDQTAP